MGIDIRREISFLRKDRVKEGLMRKSSRMMLGSPSLPLPSAWLEGLVIREGI